MRLFCLLIGLLVALVAPASAHPHIFIDAKAKIIFNDAGEVIGVENSWTFDEAFSAWQTAELDVNKDGTTSTEEMAELADENIKGLAEYAFYTYAGEGESTLPLASMDNARFVYENGRSTLTFGVEPQGPYRIKDTFEVAIYDPEYYVAITIPDTSAVTLENAPQGCAVSLQAPREMSQELADRLYALPADMLKLPPDLAAALRGVQGAIQVRCPDAAGTAAVAATAAAAVTQVAQAAPSTPFGGPPPEPGFAMPKTGFLGWIATQQRDFYQALTSALGRLKTDNNAFFVLGSLSFLYGIFHAAGPGHGKVVISSYVLANERQVRRGIVLSFAAAMLQAAVAVAFVLAAQLLINMTIFAKSDAANWICICSYDLVALLGLWLVGRKILGWGHGHGRGLDLAQKARAHLHEHDHAHHHHDGSEPHDHAHIVTPDQARGDWREQLGVVVAVGARPCSGALVVLVFALSQGLLAAGIASVFLIGQGTAITVAILATLAVSAKGLALRFAGGNGGMGAGLVWWGELLGAMLVLTFGVLLLLASI